MTVSNIDFCSACGNQLPAGCCGTFKGIPGCLIDDSAAAMQQSQQPTGYQRVVHFERVGTEDDGEIA